MAIYNLENYLSRDGFGMSLNIRRGNPNPLDNSAVWASLEAAQNYARTDATAYVGQLLTVVSDVTVDEVTVKTATAYVIDNEAGDLKEVGTSPVGDEKTITVAEDGTVSLLGVAGLTLTREVEQEDGSTVVEKINYQPLLVDGKLTWVEPSKTTVEGLATELGSLAQRVTALENIVGKAAEGENAATGLVAEVANKVDKVEGKGLSTNDLTDALKKNYDEAYEHSKVSHAPADAQANIIELIKVNGVEQTISDKAVDIVVPTKVSDLTNDKGYLTEQTDYTVTITETTDGLEDSIAKKYTFTQNGTEIGHINLAKELVVTSGIVEEVAEEGVPYENAKVGDKYIKLTIANQTTPIYIPVKDLVDVYTAKANADEVQISISSNNEVSATLTSGVKEKLNKAHEHANFELLETYTQTEEDLADAVAKKHEHTNFELLETYTQTEEDLADAVRTKHEHENQEILDIITSDKVEEWDNIKTEILGNAYDDAHNLHDIHDIQQWYEQCKEIDAERNVIASINTSEFMLSVDPVTDDPRQLSIRELAQSKVTGLVDALKEKMDAPKDGSRLITTSESTKLDKLVIGDDGSVTVDATIAVGNVNGLADWIKERSATLEGLSENNFSDALLTKLGDIEEGAQVNVIESVKINGVALSVSDKSVNIGIANESTLGVVKSSATTAQNKVNIAADGTMEVNSINVNKLVQDEDTTIVLNGGTAFNI